MKSLSLSSLFELKALLIWQKKRIKALKAEARLHRWVSEWKLATDLASLFSTNGWMDGQIRPDNPWVKISLGRVHSNPVITNPEKPNSRLQWILRQEKVPFHYESFPDKANPAHSEFSASPEWFVITGLPCTVNKIGDGPNQFFWAASLSNLKAGISFLFGLHLFIRFLRKEKIKENFFTQQTC